MPTGSGDDDAMLTWPVALGGVAIGVALGLLGAGGGILTVPFLVYGAGLDPKIAVAASLPIVGVTSAFGVISHWRAGNVRVRTALYYGMSAMIGAFLGARLAAFIAGPVQLIMLALVMIAAAARMFVGSNPTTGDAPDVAAFPFLKIAPIAFGVGVLTGLLGIGGGFLVVPTLVLFARLPMRLAVGTSLFVIALNAVAGSLGYVGRVTLPWEIIAPFAAIAIGTILVASRFTARIPQTHLRRAFAILLVLVAALILFQNRHVFSGALRG